MLGDADAWTVAGISSDPYAVPAVDPGALAKGGAAVSGWLGWLRQQVPFLGGSGAGTGSSTGTGSGSTGSSGTGTGTSSAGSKGWLPGFFRGVTRWAGGTDAANAATGRMVGIAERGAWFLAAFLLLAIGLWAMARRAS